MSEIQDNDLKFRQKFRVFMAQSLHDFEWHDLKRMMEEEIEIIDIEKWRAEREVPLTEPKTEESDDKTRLLRRY